MTSPTETREAVARTEDLHRQVWDILWFKLSCNEDNGDCWIDGMDEAADAIIADHLAPRDAEIESLRAERDAAREIAGLMWTAPDVDAWGKLAEEKGAAGIRDRMNRLFRRAVTAEEQVRQLHNEADREGQDTLAIIADERDAALSEVSRLTAALAESERQGAPVLADHRVLTLRRMLDRADRMQRCLYHAGCNIDGALYREEVDALKAVFAALTLKEPTHEH